MTTTYRATKNRSQGREAWCVIFHHPVRRDARGKPRRVRRGLGTRDDGEADQLVAQLDQLLANDSYWTPAARGRAQREFDDRVVAIFFDDMEPTQADPWELRDRVVPMPGPDQGFTRVLLLGATGAGKTTLVRQLIGTDPQTERFPSTSTAKTTIFDTEIILREGAFAAVVAFLSRDRTRNYIEECVVAAVSAAAEGAKRELVTRRLLEHSEQRFRLSYLLGTPSPGTADRDEDADSDEAIADTQSAGPSELSEDDRRAIATRLEEYLACIDRLALSLGHRLATQLDVSADSLKASDRDAFLELLEDVLRDDDDAQTLVDELLEDVESRFEALGNGQVERDRSGWPTVWSVEEEEREAFLRTINRFSSNYAPNFGRLLTPLVQGLRVAGPLRPAWWPSADVPKLVLLDGEGVGHTPASATSVSTSVTKRYDRSDAVLLVDSAAQPMVAAPLAVLRSIAVSGNEAKLVVVFTHFDQVRGDNLPNESARRDHVAASLENGVRTLDEALGAGVGRSLRRHLEKSVFFVGGIDEVLPPGRRATRSQLIALIQRLQAMIVLPPPAVASPIYDLGNLGIGVASAARQFQNSWEARLPKEHWTRIKALTRRLGYLQTDEYDTMKPAADLIRAMSEQALAFISTPRGWQPAPPSEDDAQNAINLVAREFFARLHTLVADRLWLTQLAEWQTAYDLRGAGSGDRRKNNLNAIYHKAAPVPGAVPMPEATAFLDAVRDVFRNAASAAGAVVV